jgi:predicted enzyme related to lactoylglutathione lyase
MTVDATRARAFYSELFGWQLVPMEMHGFSVHLIEQACRKIGSIIQENGLPSSHWMPYIEVADTEAACQKVQTLGGHVCVPAMDLPKLGRFAVLDDPQGGFFSVLRRPEPTPPPTYDAGTFVWDELLTTDPDAAAKFYGSLFEWPVEKMDMGEASYWLFKDTAGMMKLPPDAAHPPHWLAYVGSADVDLSAKRAVALGATMFVEPRDIPVVGRFSVLADPTGATFALYRPIRS